MICACAGTQRNAISIAAAMLAAPRPASLARPAPTSQWRTIIHPPKATAALNYRQSAASQTLCENLSAADNRAASVPRPSVPSLGRVRGRLGHLEELAANLRIG